MFVCACPLILKAILSKWRRGMLLKLASAAFYRQYFPAGTAPRQNPHRCTVTVNLFMRFNSFGHTEVGETRRMGQKQDKSLNSVSCLDCSRHPSSHLSFIRFPPGPIPPQWHSITLHPFIHPLPLSFCPSISLPQGLAESPSPVKDKPPQLHCLGISREICQPQRSEYTLIKAASSD